MICIFKLYQELRGGCTATHAGHTKWLIKHTFLPQAQQKK